MDTHTRRKNKRSGVALVRSPRNRAGAVQGQKNAARMVKPAVRGGSFAIYLGGEAKNVDLLIGKVYRVLKPQNGDGLDDLRVIDESRDDYIYPETWFAPVELPARARRVLTALV